jgi:predicted transcriptional regulator
MVKKEPNTVLDILDLSVTSLLRIVRPGKDDRRAASYLSEILRDQWNRGESVDLNSLIQLVLRPPFPSFLGLPVDQGFPRKERIELARDLGRFNADPRLQGWMQGEPLDFDELFQKGTKTPVNVVYLKGIQTQEERSFFVENLLQKLYSWIMKQQGVQNLRFLLYFDEVVGYCPPVSEPPSKKGLLLLIKQARAFGLGIILATQNPGDIDYKALSNFNVRLIGRLATQRDIDKVKGGLDLPEDSALTIQTLDKQKFLYQILDPRSSGIVSPRWLMTYHRGPLQDEEISELMRNLKEGVREERERPTPEKIPGQGPEPRLSPRPEPPPSGGETLRPERLTPKEAPVHVPVLGIPFAIKQEEVPDRVKKQKRIFGPKEVVVNVAPVYRLLLELGIALQKGVLTKTHQTKYVLMDATTGKDVELGGRLVLRPGLEALSGLGCRDVKVLRNLPDDRYTSAIELAIKMKLPQDLVRNSLRELEGRRLAKSTRVGNTKVYQRITNIPSLEMKEIQESLSPVEPVEITSPPKGRSEVELREVIRGLRDDYDLVSYRPFYYPLYTVELALENTTRAVWIDGVTGEEILSTLR